MAVEVCHDAWRQVATMYDTTNGTAFGPVFSGPAAGTEAEDFLDWHNETDGRHIRNFDDWELRVRVEVWRRQYVPAVPEPQSLRVEAPDENHSREPDGYRLDGGRMIPTDR